MTKQQPGFLNQIIRIAVYNDVEDGAGGVEPFEDIYWETSANVIQVKARRSLESYQEKLKPVFKFEVRFRKDKVVIEDMIVKWRGQDFRINQVEPDFVYKDKLVITAIGNYVPQR